MHSLEALWNISIPPSILEVLGSLPFEVDKMGKSNSMVALFSDFVLKVSRLPFDIENAVRVYHELQGILPIGSLLAYEKKDGYLFLLTRRIAGKVLCDDRYLSNPNLLYSLAAEAVRMLWSVETSSLNLRSTEDMILSAGRKFKREGLLDIQKADRILDGFKDYDEVFSYLEAYRPPKDDVLCHGDLCLPNILCEDDRVVGFIDLGLMGISHRYHDVAILSRSIKNNFAGLYGKPYPGYEENRLFDLLGIKKNDALIRYYRILDEVLG